MLMKESTAIITLGLAARKTPRPRLLERWILEYLKLLENFFGLRP
jgi:hypothetical protein